MLLKNKKPGTPFDCWDFFDKVYCISLVDREDRRAEAKRQFGRVGLLEKVEFEIVTRDLENSERGIYDSHMTCLRKGLQSGARNIMVFEDDVVFERFSPKRIKKCARFLAENPDWKAFFLGCLVTRIKPTKLPCVVKIKYRSLAHAYVLNRHFAQQLVETPWNDIPFDSLIWLLDCDQYAIYPSIAFQSNSGTDNQKFVEWDKYRRLFGGLHMVQRLSEVYYRRTVMVYVMHILALVAVMKWLL